jgi:hypothetical protein
VSWDWAKRPGAEKMHRNRNPAADDFIVFPGRLSKNFFQNFFLLRDFSFVVFEMQSKTQKKKVILVFDLFLDG